MTKEIKILLFFFKVHVHIFIREYTFYFFNNLNILLWWTQILKLKKWDIFNFTISVISY